MNPAEFSPLSAAMGGLLIGASAVLLMATIGRIAGISGIVGNLLRPSLSSRWQWAFVTGLLFGGVLMHRNYGPMTLDIESPIPLLVVGGLLVGYGTRLGSGCTSGHGVCGVSRLAPRSLVATLVFMSVGILTVLCLRLFLWTS